MNWSQVKSTPFMLGCQEACLLPVLGWCFFWLIVFLLELAQFFSSLLVSFPFHLTVHHWFTAHRIWIDHIVLWFIPWRVLQFAGVDPLQAGNVVQLVLVLGLTIGWISTYIFRVSNKEMTYAQQLRDYENKVMEVRSSRFILLILAKITWKICCLPSYLNFSLY